MAIIRPCELKVENKKFRVIIAGYPGIGKTTLALSAPNPILIDLDDGVMRVKAQHRKDTLIVSDYDELIKDMTAENLKDYESIVVDTGGRLFDFLKGWAKQEDPKYIQKDGTLTLKGYGAVGKKFADIINDWYYNLKKHIIIVFHAKEEKDGDSTKLRILIEGQSKDNVWQPIDLGGFIEIQQGRRTIGFTNCEKYFAKGTFGISGTRTIPELDANTQNNFLTKLFEEANANIAAEKAIYEKESEDYKKVVNDIKPLIDGMTSETFTQVQEAIKTAKHVLTSEKELKGLFMQKVNELGYKWDKTKKDYIKNESTEG